ncbi:MAG: M20/M25/M40 family metallo-hydrolase, partial [Gemmatimonadetes bacterium]|nr:M20/M25/M40 family metallo-hydrolase [Gemmatimonadota bacterium]
IRFIIEGEEEFGGHSIERLLQEEPERTEADAILVCDTSYYAPGIPAVYTALRGICYVEVEVRTAQRDLHSGNYGGAAPNAMETLCRILGDLKGRDGRINIPGLYEAVEPPTEAELAAWQKLPFDMDNFLAEEVTARALAGQEDRSVFERLWALPTFEIHGIMGGFTGEGAKTVIPARATAKVSPRLVPNQRWQTVLGQLEEAVRAVAPDYADIEVRPIHGADPVQVDVTQPAFAVLDQAFTEVVGRGPVVVRSGGSIPVVASLGLRGAPILLTGIGLPDDGLHSPNEKLDLQQLWDGVAIFGRFFEQFADQSV